MHKSFLHLLNSLIFAILLFIISGWNDVFAYSIDAETQSSILYVKPGANGTCASWADACELQTALFNAVAGDQIWVATGTYKPTTSPIVMPPSRWCRVLLFMAVSLPLVARGHNVTG